MLIEDNQDIRRQVREYVVSSVYGPDPGALADSASLIETGIIDSTGVLELVAFLESTFGVTVGDEEMLPENLDSIARVAAFVCRKGIETPIPGATAAAADALAA
jgi:acyl carrier protein